MPTTQSSATNPSRRRVLHVRLSEQEAGELADVLAKMNIGQRRRATRSGASRLGWPATGYAEWTASDLIRVLLRHELVTGDLYHELYGSHPAPPPAEDVQ